MVRQKSAAALPKFKRGEQSTRHWDRSAQSGTRHLSQRSLSNQRNAVKGAVKPGRANSIQPQVEPIGRLSIIFHIQRVTVLILSGIMARSSKLVAVRRGKVLLVRRRRDRRWMFPGGRKRARENDKDCLQREIREELPKLKLGRVRLWKEVKAKNRRSGRKMSDAIFVTSKATGNLTIGDKKEIDRAVWRKPRGIRLTPTARYVRDKFFGH